MNIMNIRHIIALILVINIGIPSYLLGQNSEKKDNLQRFALGLGSDFRNVADKQNAMKPLELSMKYRLNNEHVLYINMPLLFKNKNSSKDRPYDLDVLKLKQRMYGIGIGYEYHFIQQNKFSEFIGIGFDYYHTNEKYTSHDYTDDVPDVNLKDAKYTFKQNIYALSPQIGIDYTIGAFKIELKCKYSPSEIVEKETGKYGNYSEYKKDSTYSTKLLKSLALSLYYNF